MKNHPYATLVPGSSLFDMHNSSMAQGASPFWIAEPHRILQEIYINTTGGSKFIANALSATGLGQYSYHNKMLVVLECGRTNRAGICQIKAAWSYDDSWFGLMTIEVEA